MKAMLFVTLDTLTPTLKTVVPLLELTMMLPVDWNLSGALLMRK